MLLAVNRAGIVGTGIEESNMKQAFQSESGRLDARNIKIQLRTYFFKTLLKR
jgi:hypothetical protein